MRGLPPPPAGIRRLRSPAVVAILAALLAVVTLGRAADGPAPIRLSSPLPSELPATSSFAEYRGDHLHAGLDFSTSGELGWEVRAAADGDVVRLKVERRGYGRAIYVRHPGGYETVYGHLHAFEDDALGLERYVEAEQKRLGTRFPGDLYLKSPRPVRRGQVIAVSGEAGGGPPHLHFELRHHGEPVDPMRYGELRPAGFAAPVLRALWVIPRGPCRVDGKWAPVRLPFRRRAGRFVLESTPVVEGQCDLAVDAVVPGAGKMGLSRLELECGGERLYRADLHRFSFEQSGEAGLVYDPSRSRMGPARYTYRLRALPGLDLPGVEGAWLVEPPQGQLDCTLHAEDASGRAAGASFRMDRRPALPYAQALPAEIRAAQLFERLLLVNGETALDPRRLPEGADTHPGLPAIRFPGRRGGTMRLDGGIELAFAPGALFAPHPVGLAKAPDAPAPVAGLEVVVAPVRLEPADLFLRRPAVWRARVPDPERCAFYRYDAEGERWEAIRKKARAGAVEASSRTGGTIAVLRDVSPPQIEGVQLRREERLGTRRLVFPVKEIGEGIDVDAFEVTLDGEPVEAEYDPDRGWGQVWLPDDLHGKHQVTAGCRDRAGNASPAFSASVSL